MDLTGLEACGSKRRAEGAQTLDRYSFGCAAENVAGLVFTEYTDLKLNITQFIAKKWVVLARIRASNILRGTTHPLPCSGN